MAKPLSQEEIDVLLNGEGAADKSPRMSPEADGGRGDAGEDAGEERIESYNFKRPRLFSQAQTRVLNYVHESFARDLSVYLSAQLRTIVDISLAAVDQVMYSEFVMASAPPSALYVLRAEEMEHRCVFEIDPRLAIYTIEKLFGGNGKFLGEPRQMSPIEQRVMSRVMGRAFGELESAWEQVHDLSFAEEAFEANAEFVQIIPAAEPALVASFEVQIYDEPSFINICYPYLLLEKILGRAGMEQWISSSTTPASPEVRERYEEALRETDVTMSAELGRAVVPITELMQLQEGDVVPLDRETSEPVQVFVNDKPKFKAVAGRSGQRRALRITEVKQPRAKADAAESRSSSAPDASPLDHEQGHALSTHSDGAGSPPLPAEDVDAGVAPA